MLQWYGHVLRNEGSDWIKRQTTEDFERGYAKDCQACRLNREDAMDRSRWRKLIKDG